MGNHQYTRALTDRLGMPTMAAHAPIAHCRLRDKEVRQVADNALTRRSFLGSLALAAGASVLAAGCGSATGQATTRSISTSAAATTTSTASAARTAVTSATRAAVTSAVVSANAAKVTLNWWPGWPGNESWLACRSSPSTGD